jgi:Aldehyde:ferredoxin oxidoreductase
MMAAVMNDSHRAAARGGPGAVMGSKNLKAIAVRGKEKPTIADKEAQVAVNKEIAGWQKDGPVAGMLTGFKELGTTMFYENSLLCGDASVKNWFRSSDALTEEEMKEPLTQEKYKQKQFRCSTCPVGCGAIYDVKEEGVHLEHAGRPEYETMGGFGSQMLNSDPITINICNHLCNEYGLDTISVAGTIAWAMECYSDGILSLEELDGIDLKWGNKEAIVEMTEKVCKGEGVGEILQHGSRFAADHFGRGHNALCEATGIELPQHDPRWSTGLVRTYQYDPTPGRHVKGGLSPQYGNNPPEVKYNYDNTGEADVNGAVAQEILSGGGYCQFTEFALSPGAHVGLINAVTGFNYSEEESRKLGLRIFIMRHAFNLREGFRRDYWTLSDRMMGIPPMTEGPNAGVTVDGKKLADNFFKEIGFDQDSVPLRETLEEIGGLEPVIRDLFPA